MRMRRKPWARPELDAFAFYIKAPATLKGEWKQEFQNDHPIHLELGCGKGVFIASMAALHPEVNYIAIDIKSDVLGYAKRALERENPEGTNTRIMSYEIERIDEMLSAEDNIQRIYINFCNPWPKDRHKKHRLTHTKQLETYKRFLAPDGEIYFKTDDDTLFEESLEYFKEAGFSILEITYDLHQSELPKQCTTEHEEMFSAKGIPIKFLRAAVLR